MGRGFRFCLALSGFFYWWLGFLVLLCSLLLAGFTGFFFCLAIALSFGFLWFSFAFSFLFPGCWSFVTGLSHFRHIFLVVYGWDRDIYIEYMGGFYV